jgi:hypothetical protein
MSRGGTPLASSFFTDVILLSVISRLRPPTLPSWRATSRPALVRSMVNSLSISANLAMTSKKKRPEAVPVSMESVRLLNWTHCSWSSPTRSTRFLSFDPICQVSKRQEYLPCERSLVLLPVQGARLDYRWPCLRRNFTGRLLKSFNLQLKVLVLSRNTSVADEHALIRGLPLDWSLCCGQFLLKSCRRHDEVRMAFENWFLRIAKASKHHFSVLKSRGSRNLLFVRTLKPTQATVVTDQAHGSRQ